MRTYFGLTIAGLVFAVVCGAAMSWDGSYYLFKILDTQAPFVVHNRWIHAPLHLVVLFANQFTADLGILQTVLGLVYTAIPLVALVTSWQVVRNNAQPLFIWAALGIGLGTVPGQFFFLSEAYLAIHLFWPLLLAIGTRIGRSHIPVVILCATIVFLAHPIAIVLLAFGAGLAVAVGVVDKHARYHMWLWALGLSLMSTLRLALFLVLMTDYEKQLLSRDMQWHMFKSSVVGFPLVSWVCACLAAFLIFELSALNRAPRREFVRVMHYAALASVVAAGGALVVWARDPRLWMDAMNFRSWALFASLPFMVIAALESLIHGTGFSSRIEDDLTRRIQIARVVALFFLLVLSVQSTAWFNLTNRLRATIKESSSPCISVSSIGWLARTPLRHWATPAYAIILQGRAPEKLILDGDGCSEPTFSEAFHIAWFDLRSRNIGWFDLRLSGQRSDP